jgi:hypothetical protein
VAVGDGVAGGRRLRVEEGHDRLQRLRERLDALAHLLVRELPVALRDLEVRRVDLRLEVARLDDDVAARHALHVPRCLAEALDAQREPRLLVHVDEGLALDLPGGGLRLRAAGRAVLDGRPPVEGLLADLRHALLLGDEGDELPRRHRAQLVHVDAGQLGRQLGVLLAAVHDDVALVGLVEKDQLAEDGHVDGVAAVGAVAGDLDLGLALRLLLPRGGERGEHRGRVLVGLLGLDGLSRVGLHGRGRDVRVGVAVDVDGRVAVDVGRAVARLGCRLAARGREREGRRRGR